MSPILQVVGARPNFMKAAPVIDAVRRLGGSQVLVHTGQHYDALMSDVFFEELDIPEPDVNLGVGSGSHANQTAALMVGLEQAFVDIAPSIVVAYGDVNSTLAAAVVAAKLDIPVAHVEAGLRSFDRTMPEEVNRVVTDALASVLFATSPEAIGHLAQEGVPPERVHFVGNSMIDTLLRARGSLRPDATRAALGIDGPFVLSTLHRPSNVDDPSTAKRIVDELKAVSTRIQVVLPLHPRGREVLGRAGLQATATMRVVEPLGYLDFVSLMSVADAVLTDSGGVQEETTILDVPCLTVRPNTERPITVSHGTNRLVKPEEIAEAIDSILTGSWTPPTERPPLWDGRSGERIAAVLTRAIR